MGVVLYLFYAREPERNRRFELPQGATNLAVSPDGKWVAVGCRRGHGAHVWRTSDAVLVAHLEPTTPFLFSAGRARSGQTR